MDPKNNANPTAPDDGQSTQPQTDTQADSMPSLGSETTQDVTDAPVTDTTAPPVLPQTDGTSASGTETSSTPPDVVGLGDTQPSITSEAPASPTPGDMTPPTVTPPADAGVPATPPSQPGEPVPPVAPTPAPNNDKKTIMVLGVVAAVLVVAIALLYFVA